MVLCCKPSPVATRKHSENYASEFRAALLDDFSPCTLGLHCGQEVNLLGRRSESRRNCASLGRFDLIGDTPSSVKVDRDHFFSALFAFVPRPRATRFAQYPTFRVGGRIGYITQNITVFFFWETSKRSTQFFRCAHGPFVERLWTWAINHFFFCILGFFRPPRREFQFYCCGARF